MTVISYLAGQIFNMSHAALGPVDLLGCLSTKGGMIIIAFSLIAAWEAKTR